MTSISLLVLLLISIRFQICGDYGCQVSTCIVVIAIAAVLSNNKKQSKCQWDFYLLLNSYVELMNLQQSSVCSDSTYVFLFCSSENLCMDITLYPLQFRNQNCMLFSCEFQLVSPIVAWFCCVRQTMICLARYLG